MRPLKLSMNAFGPFGDEQRIDFETVGTNALLLIHGATGSGKTSILDAICFALYGESSGDARSGRQLRSDHAEAAMITSVTLDFAIGTNRYRVRRSPEQLRPKRRGVGATIEATQATLWQRNVGDDDNHDGQVIANRARKVTEAIERLLGFRSEQFRQVVVLPQNDFRRLLLATSGERQSILEALFETETYRLVEEALRKTARYLGDETRLLQHERTVLLQQAELDSAQQLLAQQKALEQELEDSQVALEGLRQRADNSRRKLVDGEQAASKLEVQRKAQTEVNRLRAQAAEHEAIRKELEIGRRAAALSDAENELNQRRREARQSEQRAMAAEERLLETEREKTAAETAADTLQRREDESEQLQAKVNELARLAELSSALQQAQTELTQHREVAIDTRAERDARAEKHSAAAAALERKLERVAELSERANEAEAARTALALLQGTLNQKQQLERIEMSLDPIQEGIRETENQRTRLEQERHAATEKAARLEERWFERRLAALAAELEPGSACPLCGSKQHAISRGPDPNYTGEEESLIVARRQLSGLEQELAAVDSQLLEKRSAAARLDAEARTLRTALGAGTSTGIAELEQQIDVQRRVLAEAERAAERRDEIERGLGPLRQQLSDCRRTLDHAEDVHALAELKKQKCLAVVNERTRCIPKRWREPGAIEREVAVTKRTLEASRESIAAQRKTISDTAERYAARRAELGAAKRQLRTDRRRADRCESQFRQRRLAADLQDDKQYALAKRLMAKTRQFEQTLASFDEARRDAEARLTHAEEAAAGLTLPHIGLLREKAAESKQAMEAALQRHAALRHQCKQVAQHIHQLEQAEQRLAALEKRFTVVGRLADVAGGRNDRRMTFQQFVLSTLLDDVLLAASRRLKLVSKGRFELHRAQPDAAGHRVGALDLEVYDAHTGTQRPAHTLSGGETFLAALSLALGLSEVVQARAGGIRLETIFIDEGFGSLDPEALDLALRALADLQTGGRLVGIISHIPELKERIDLRLEVAAGKRGSRATLVGLGKQPKAA